MNSTLVRWLTTPFLIIYSLWAVLFYQLVFTPWTLQYSYLGVLAVILASLLFVFVFPKKDRRFIYRFSLFAIMTSYAISSFAGESTSWRVIDWVIFLILGLVIGRLLVQQKVFRLFWVIIVLTALEIWMPLGDLSVLSHFNVDYIGRLASQDSQVPSLPEATVANPQKPGQQTILSIRAHHPYKAEAQSLVNTLAQNGSNQIENALVQIQHSYDFIAIQPGHLHYHVSFATPQELAQVPATTLGLSDFPFSTSHYLNINGNSRLFFSTSTSPGSLLSMLLAPGQLPSDMSNLNVQTANAESSNWQSLTGRPAVDTLQGLSLNSNGLLTGSYNNHPVKLQTNDVSILGVYRMLPKSILASPTAVLEGNNMIQIVALPPDHPRIVATLRGSYSHPLTNDIVFADVLGNGEYQLLINTIPAQIVELTPSMKWKVLWYSSRDSFRFETVFPQSGGDLIIANSPSLLSYSPIRYLGGYKYVNHQLVQQFRVYHGNLVNVKTAYVSSGSQPELLMSVYEHQEIMLLGPERIPWYEVAVAGYVLMIIVGLIRRFGRRSAA